MGNCIQPNQSEPEEPTISEKNLAVELPLAAWYSHPHMKQLWQNGDDHVKLRRLLQLARDNLKHVKNLVRSVFVVWFQEFGHRTREIREEIFVYLVLAPDFTMTTRRGEQIWDRERRIPMKIVVYFKQQMDEFDKQRDLDEDEDDVELADEKCLGVDRMIRGLAFGDFKLIALKNAKLGVPLRM